ncbi:aldose 1-epimerase [Streptomonospora nanhaiensis]|uniref:Aldose 1-epimerase n=1 Tax=Streptomonospora nanhaiensis TaxID=1323731 RepID=A0A853BIN6_9ACTN|nr:aldose 1-epimerase [Streptomonospora nanhaiensis]
MGDAIELAAGGYRAVVSRRGAALCGLTHEGRDLVWGYPPEQAPASYQGQLLAPWPNRIADGRYRFGGLEHRLEVTEPERGTALHGLVHAVPWLPVEIAGDRTTLTHLIDGAPGYPFRLELSVTYALDAAGGLEVAVEARNTGDGAAPYGVGAHPYLRVPLPLDDAVLRLPAGKRLPVDGRLLPDGPPEPVAGTEHDFRTPRRIGTTAFDTAFTDLERDAEGRAWTVLAAGGRAVGVWADRSYGWLQVFSAEGLPGGLARSAFAVEPMTCPPDAFNSGTDLLVLEPGAAAVRSRFGICAVDPGEV